MFVEITKDYLGQPVGKRIDVSDADAKHLIDQGYAKKVDDDLLTPAVNKALEVAFGKFTQALDGIVNESLKRFAGAQAKSYRNAVPQIFGPGGHGDPDRTKAALGESSGTGGAPAA